MLLISGQIERDKNQFYHLKSSYKVAATFTKPV